MQRNRDWEKFKANNGTIADMYRRFLKRKALNIKNFIWREPVGASSEGPFGISISSPAISTLLARI